MSLLVAAVPLVVATILMEAKHEPYEGKLAVAHVINNRTQKKYFSNGTYLGTILRPLQFSCWNTHDPGRLRLGLFDTEDPDVLDAMRAWVEATGNPRPEWKDIILYHAKEPILRKLGLRVPAWAALSTHVVTIGNHIFYKKRD